MALETRAIRRKDVLVHSELTKTPAGTVTRPDQGGGVPGPTPAPPPAHPCPRYGRQRLTGSVSERCGVFTAGQPGTKKHASGRRAPPAGQP